MLVRRFVQLFVGLFLYGIAIALIVRGELGVAPWDVLTQGIAKQTGLSFGLITVHHERHRAAAVDPDPPEAAASAPS